MAVIVVDASALSALAFEEPEAPAVAQALEGHSLTAPSLLVYEIGNVCWTKCRKHPPSAPAFRKAFADLPHLKIRFHAIEPAQVLALAERSDITFYDASYLWLSIQLRAPLITLDRRLQQVIAASALH